MWLPLGIKAFYLSFPELYMMCDCTTYALTYESSQPHINMLFPYYRVAIKESCTNTLFKVLKKNQYPSVCLFEECFHSWYELVNLWWDYCWHPICTL